MDYGACSTVHSCYITKHILLIKIRLEDYTDSDNIIYNQLITTRHAAWLRILKENTVTYSVYKL